MKSERKGWRGAVAILLSGGIPLLARLVLLTRVPIPHPSIHDEFSYLLAADTFAHRMLTNPPHPLWKFFESFHILQQPTYMSKFPPMQGLVLALGQAIFGHAFWGVCLSAALMCASVCWVLQAWMSWRWALAGSLLLGAKLVPAWGNCYWGGSVAAIGGCLLLGSLTRATDPQTPLRRLPVYACVMASGAAILANSRPWEGAVFSLPIAVALGWWIARSRGEILKARLRRVLVPCAVIAALTVAGMAYYNWRITGSALTLPYTLYTKTYTVYAIFIWESERSAPSYSHDVIRRMHLEWEPEFQNARNQATWRGFWKAKLSVLPLTVFLTLLACGLIRKEPAVRVLASILAVFLIGLCLQRYLLLHYLAPATPAIIAVIMLVFRQISRFEYHGRAIGRAIAFVLFVGAFASALVSGVRSTSGYSSHLGPERAAVERRLAAIPGRHVVIVHYGPKHWIPDEWVYNAADIDGSRIIWARDMGTDVDRQLQAYYPGRKFWLLQPDVSPPLLEALPPPRKR
jgi:hypothetical protein